MSHPPFAHNPHVYDGIDPDGPTSVTVTSRVADIARITVDGVEVEGIVVETDTEPSAAVNIATGVVTPPGEQLPDADEDSVDVDGDGQVSGYEVFTKADLIGECEARGLATSGNKPDLVARLQAADKAGAGE